MSLRSDRTSSGESAPRGASTCSTSPRASTWTPHRRSSSSSSSAIIHRHVVQTAAWAVEAAGRVGAAMDQVQAQIGRVTEALQHVRLATLPAEKALERTVERLGAAAVNTATSLLPKGLQQPIRVAVQAVERALDLVRDFGLGR